MFSLEGKEALVTGASGNLGEALAEGLAEAGARVYLNARNETLITSLVRRLSLKGYDVRAAIFDVTDDESIGLFLSSLEGKKLDILVNNAYNGAAGSVETSTKDSYRLSYEVGLIAAHGLVQMSLPLLREAKRINGDASVINISSMYGIVSPDLRVYDSKEVSNPPFYGAVKAALIQWTKYAACEFAEEGIRFNSISPGAFPSQAVQDDEKALVERIKNKIPMLRLGKPSDLIGPLVFLSSSSSGYITGINIPVDGGWTSW